MTRGERKAALHSLVLALWDNGIRSSNLIGLALGVSRVHVHAVLVLHNRRRNPRNDPADLLAGVSPELRRAIAEFRSVNKLLTNCPAEEVKPA